MQREWNEPLNQHPPSYYFDNNIYGSFVSDAAGVALRHRSGCKNIMWSSDYPHNETTFPHSHDTIANNFEGVPVAERDWIIAGCAEKSRRIRRHMMPNPSHTDRGANKQTSSTPSSD